MNTTNNIHRSTLLSMIRVELGDWATHDDATAALSAALLIGAARRRAKGCIEITVGDVPAMLTAICTAEVAA